MGFSSPKSWILIDFPSKSWFSWIFDGFLKWNTRKIEQSTIETPRNCHFRVTRLSVNALNKREISSPSLSLEKKSSLKNRIRKNPWIFIVFPLKIKLFIDFPVKHLSRNMWFSDTVTEGHPVLLCGSWVCWASPGTILSVLLMSYDRTRPPQVAAL